MKHSSRQFTESTDYVNVNPHPGLAPHAAGLSTSGTHGSFGTSVNFTRQTPYSRPMTSVQTKMPAQNFFLPTSSLFRDEDSENPGSVPPQRMESFKLPLEPNLNSTLTELPNWKKAVCNVPSSTNGLQTSSVARTSPKKPKRKFMKPPPQDLKRILIGSVEHVIRWNKTAREAELSYMFEAVGTLDSWTAKGSVQLLFLRGELGQIIQGLFYSVDHRLPPLNPGSTYSVVGKMIGSHKMIVMDATEILPEEKPALQRLAFHCQRALNSAAGNPPAMNT